MLELSKFVQEASLRFCKSPDGVDAALLVAPWWWLEEVLSRWAIGEIIDETARFNRFPVGVLLKLKARFTYK